MKKVIMYSSVVIVLIMTISNIETPLVGDLMASLPFSKNYLLGMFGFSAIFSFLFIAFSDPGDRKVKIVGEEQGSFNPELRASWITLFLLGTTCVLAYTQNAFCVGTTFFSFVLSLMVLGLLMYNFTLFVHSFFAQNSGDVWSNNSDKIRNYVHRGKGHRNEPEYS